MGLAGGDQLLAGQGSQIAAPRVSEYVVDTQLSQFDEPLTLLKYPGLHAVHAWPSGPVKPVLHTHCVEFTEPGREVEYLGHIMHAVPPVSPRYAPASHSSQLPVPTTSLYVPGTHRVHGSPLMSPEAPKMQRQSDEFPLPGKDCVFGAHGVQLTDPAYENVSAGQRWHAVLPVSFENVPASHCVQFPVPLTSLNVPSSHGVHVKSYPEAPGMQIQSKISREPGKLTVLSGQPEQSGCPGIE